MLPQLATIFLTFVPAAFAAGHTTFHIAGDSTAANGGGGGGTQGWGPDLQGYFDTSIVTVQNGARGGRSARTFLSDGSWDAVINQVQPNDYVLIQFGHNDASPITDATRSRGVLRGIGENFQDTINGVTKKVINLFSTSMSLTWVTNFIFSKAERVYSFGHYLRTMVNDTRAKGGIPILASKTLNKKWDNTTRPTGVFRGDEWSTWSLQVAQAKKTAFLDMRQIAADAYDKIGIKVLDEFFPIDGTHFSPAGAQVNAQSITRALSCINLTPVVSGLSAAGKALGGKPLNCHDSEAVASGSSSAVKSSPNTSPVLTTAGPKVAPPTSATLLAGGHYTPTVITIGPGNAGDFPTVVAPIATEQPTLSPTEATAAPATSVFTKPDLPFATASTTSPTLAAQAPASSPHLYPSPTAVLPPAATATAEPVPTPSDNETTTLPSAHAGATSHEDGQTLPIASATGRAATRRTKKHSRPTSAPLPKCQPN
ncbi:hypothetical protein HKX48_002414 [Thoreauomyces humboldtii]|nr:hypothetical protein HKX48_002414 [Thoreauomyces humboldtii]